MDKKILYIYPYSDKITKKSAATDFILFLAILAILVCILIYAFLIF